jgi:DNA polymerase elongation subunit (family B)
MLRREGRLFLTLNAKTGRYELDYGVGNFVLLQTKNINPVTLQVELLKAYEKFYSMRNIAAALMRRRHALSMQTAVAKFVGRHLVKTARGQVAEHVEWLKAHQFDKDFAEWRSPTGPGDEAGQRLRLSSRPTKASLTTEISASRPS